MARRLFNDNAFSENGWPYVDEGSCTWIVVPGTDPPVHLQIQNGPPLAIMGAFAADINAYVERVRDGDSACWTPGNSVATSNHPGATAMDIDWELHPFHDRGSFNSAQLATIQELLDFYEDMIFWAGIDWSKGGWGSPIDEMHWQMDYDTYDQDNDRPFPKVLDFIRRKIRSDGFSTFRREGVPLPPPPPPPNVVAGVLARATGLTLDRATEILPTVASGLQAAQCTNVNRIAMWLAQCGEESAGFSTTEEFASGAEYEGRADLGNIQPGDGVRFKGRTWIQITGRDHYREFSEWAFDKGFVHSPTQFVDDPESLGDLRWAGIGAAWYWTVSRPDINALSDAGDVVTVTHRINGGEHGLADRQDRYARAHALGDQLLALSTGAIGPIPPSPQPQPQPQPQPGEGFLMALSDQEQRDFINGFWQFFHAYMDNEESLSPVRHVGEGSILPLHRAIRNIDGSVHLLTEIVIGMLLKYPDPDALALLNEVARVDVMQHPERQRDSKLAKAILLGLNLPAATIAAPQTVYVSTPSPQPAMVPIPPLMISKDEPEVLPAVREPAVVHQQSMNTPDDLLNTLERLKVFDDSYRQKFEDLTKEQK